MVRKPRDLVDLKDIDTVIWDLDGTIINSFEVFKAILTEVLPEFGLQLPNDETLQHNFHGKLAQTIRDIVPGIESDSKLDQIITAFLDAQQQHYIDPLRHFYPDALHALRALGSIGLSQIIVTSREHEGRGVASPHAIIAAAKLAEVIKYVIAGDASQFHKPDRRLLDVIAPQFVIDPQRTLVIGDQFVDAQFAHNIGSGAVLVDRNGGIPHLDRLEDNWQAKTRIVPSLDRLIRD